MTWTNVHVTFLVCLDVKGGETNTVRVPTVKPEVREAFQRMMAERHTRITIEGWPGHYSVYEHGSAPYRNCDLEEAVLLATELLERAAGSAVGYQ